MANYRYMIRIVNDGASDLHQAVMVSKYADHLPLYRPGRRLCANCAARAAAARWPRARRGLVAGYGMVGYGHGLSASSIILETI